jgi:hypothetical protein
MQGSHVFRRKGIIERPNSRLFYHLAAAFTKSGQRGDKTAGETS